MFTEEELRAAMQHSAARADGIADAPLDVVRRRRGILLPAVAAATVVAVAAGVVVLAGRDHQQPSHRSAAPAVSVHQHPLTSTPIASFTRAIGAPTHVAADISGVLDPVQLHYSGDANWMLGGNGDVARGSSNIEVPISGAAQLLELDVVGPDSALDASRIPRNRPVEIAGTTGYYSKFKLFPLDGSSNDKYLSHWTIAFRTPAGDWAFVSLEKPGADFADASVDDPGQIASAFSKLGVEFRTGTSRVPLRTGYLPSGLRLTDAMFSTGEKDSGLVDASFSAGAKTVDIQLAPVSGPADPGGASCASHESGCNDAAGVVGGYRVVVGTHGYDEETARKILATLQTADPTDRSTYWTLAQAF